MKFWTTQGGWMAFRPSWLNTMAIWGDRGRAQRQPTSPAASDRAAVHRPPLPPRPGPGPAARGLPRRVSTATSGVGLESNTWGRFTPAVWGGDPAPSGAPRRLGWRCTRNIAVHTAVQGAGPPDACYSTLRAPSEALPQRPRTGRSEAEGHGPGAGRPGVGACIITRAASCRARTTCQALF